MEKQIEEKTRYIDLYKRFRAELDNLCVPAIIDDLRIIKPIKADGHIVGMVCGFTDYIDAVYVIPEYRRRGLARKAVLNYVKGKIGYGIRLRIINNNEVAKRFWSSLFNLKELGGNNIDTMYEIVSARKDKAYDEQAD